MDQPQCPPRSAGSSPLVCEVYPTDQPLAVDVDSSCRSALRPHLPPLLRRQRQRSGPRHTHLRLLKLWTTLEHTLATLVPLQVK